MPRVLLTTGFPDWPLARQTPGSRGVWEDFEFVFDEQEVACDAWVCFEPPLETTRAFCPPKNTFFLSAEPPEICSYRRLFLDQFRWVVTCHPTRHRGLLATAQSHPWHVGVDHDRGRVATLDYDAFVSMPPPRKTRLISAVISNKKMTPGHTLRIELVERLKDVLGDDFAVYGTGHNQIGDKWDAVAPFRFHLALENAYRPHFVTEKISDAYLGSAFPFYAGAPNVREYFPEGSYEPIDLSRPDDAIERILRGIEAGLDEARREQVAEARRRVLDRWNLFPMLARLLRERMVDGARRPLNIHPKRPRARLALASVRRLFRQAA